MCIGKLRCSGSFDPFNVKIPLLQIPAGSAQASADSDTSFASASACTGSAGPDGHRAA